MEAVGLVLAMLPLVISAVKHFEDVTQPFNRYHNYGREVIRLLRNLKTQRTIFRNECRLLLAACAGSDPAADMLNDLAHLGWKDIFLEQAFCEHLSDSREAIFDIVSSIRDKLVELEGEGDRFARALADKTTIQSVGDKIKFAFSKTRIQENVAVLRDLMQDFQSLASQTEKLASKKRTLTSKRPSNNVIERYSSIREASKKLYETLSNAYTKHTEHHAHLSLMPRCGESGPQVRFNIAFRRFPDQVNATWLTLESSDEKNNHADTALIKAFSEYAGSSKRRKSRSPSPGTSLSAIANHRSSPKHKSKSVRFYSPSPPPASFGMPMQLPQVVNLCAHSNFCNQLRDLMQSPDAHASHTCIGFLEHASRSKYLVYIDQNRCRHSGSKLSTASLAEIFKNPGTGNLALQQNSPISLPHYERLRVARLLATALLQFHATPWLRSSWGSQDVLFYNEGSQNSKNLSQLQEPFVNVYVKGPNSITQASAFISRTFAPNPFLFGLGVILLELAFEAPLKSMQRASDYDGGHEDRYTEFFTAKRVSRTVSSTLGPRYSEIVRKCLNCDFGCGDDLNGIALQECFYHEVVCELEHLETSFRALQLGM